jgi:predicted GNAT family N-acyltransferase
MIRIEDYTPVYRQACMEVFLSNVPDFFTQAEIPQYEDWLDILAKQNGHDHYFVAVEAGDIVACGGFSLEPREHLVSFTWGFVRKDKHRQGIGKMLLEYRISQIQTLYPDAPIRLDTTQHSKAFFERYGFATVLYTTDGYAPGMDRYDMVLLPVG